MLCVCVCVCVCVQDISFLKANIVRRSPPFSAAAASHRVCASSEASARGAGLQVCSVLVGILSTVAEQDQGGGWLDSHMNALYTELAASLHHPHQPRYTELRGKVLGVLRRYAEGVEKRLRGWAEGGNDGAERAVCAQRLKADVFLWRVREQLSALADQQTHRLAEDASAVARMLWMLHAYLKLRPTAVMKLQVRCCVPRGDGCVWEVRVGWDVCAAS